MTLLLPWMPPDGLDALIIWGTEIGECAATKPAGGPWPFYMMTELPGGDDKITHFGKYRVHAFDIERSGNPAILNARNASWAMHRRILAMGPPFMGQQSITLTNGQVVQPDLVKTKVSPNWEKYTEDGTVERYVSEYDIHWRFLAVS